MGRYICKLHFASFPELHDFMMINNDNEIFWVVHKLAVTKECVEVSVSRGVLCMPTKNLWNFTKFNWTWLHTSLGTDSNLQWQPLPLANQRQSSHNACLIAWKVFSALFRILLLFVCILLKFHMDAFVFKLTNSVLWRLKHGKKNRNLLWAKFKASITLPCNLHN